MKTLEGMVQNAIDRKEGERMTKWLVGYARIPTYHNPPHTAVVESKTGAEAQELVRRRLNDLGTIKLYVIEPARLYQPEDLEGSILSMG